MKAANTNRGVQDACRDRWIELNNIIDFLRIGGDPALGNEIPDS